MKSKNRYLPITLVVGTVGVLVLASFPPKWFAKSQDQSPPAQQQPSGPQPDVGETVLVPKKSQPTSAQPNTAQPTTTQPAAKPEKINPNEIYTLTTSTNLVNVDVMVVDNNGSPLQNLEKKNFQLSDDGVPQAITNFGTGEAPMTICLLVEFANRWWPFLVIALRYSYSFLEVIQPKDWVAVVSFDLKSQILTDFTQDRSEVRAGLDQLRIPGFSESCLYDALAFVLDRMKEVHGRKAVVAVVTGLDTFSKLTYDQCLKIVRASDTPIYPISIMEFITVRSPRTEGITALQAENALKTMASYSGGQAYFPRFEQEVPSDYQQIAQQLRMQYSLGFVPTNATKDGQFHKLKVSVVDDQGNPLTIFNEKGKKVKYHIVARDGYYAPKS
ncbi:MAG TPA: VWA domain-containing protein [Terriglobia bacterium]|nr:VWA domain-containing protein [Terriglobia bacterium]